MSDKISVIVPIYNGEKYLVRCFDSLKRQTWQNIEFLLIDDGSTDGSAAICRQYVDNDPRFQYHYKENGGVSSARNLGLNLATGDYIGFCDCDDWVDDNYYSLLIDAAQKTDADMVSVGIVYESGNSRNAVSKAGECQIITREDAMIKLALGTIVCSACNKLFSANTCKQLHFREDLRVGEDGLYCTEAIMQTNKVAICEDIVYHYMMNGDSVMHSAFHPKIWDAVIANSGSLTASQNMSEKVTNAWQTCLVKTVILLLEKSYMAHALEKERYRSCVKLLRENNSKSIMGQLSFGEKCRYYTFKSGWCFLNVYCFICPLLYRMYRSGKRKTAK